MPWDAFGAPVSVAVVDAEVVGGAEGIEQATSVREANSIAAVPMPSALRMDRLSVVIRTRANILGYPAHVNKRLYREAHGFIIPGWPGGP